MIEDRLYCGHAAAPWLTAYLVQGETLVKTGAPSLTPFQIEQIKRRNNVESVLVLIAGQMKTYEKKRYDLKLIDYIERTYTFTLVGYFTCDEPERVDENTIRMQCYDRMVKFQDTLVDDFVTSLGYPIRLGELLNRLCTLMSVPLGTQAIFNSDYQVKKNFRASNTSARQLLQLIAEIACCFAVISPSGTLELRWYTDLDYLIKEDYTNLRTADYVVQKIDKLQVRSTENDVGVIVGTGKNKYTIENNSLLYADTDAELRPVAEKIYNRIKDFSYIPYEITTKGNYLIRAGMAVQIEGVKGTRIRGLVMSRHMTGVMALSDTYRATGNQQREVQSSLVNQQIQRLRGRTNELVMTLEETKNTLTTVESDMETVKTTVGELKLTSEQFNVTLTETKELLEGTDKNPGLVQRMASMELSLDRFNVILQGTDESQGLIETVAQLQLSLEGLLVQIQNAGLKFTKDGLEVSYKAEDGHLKTAAFKEGGLLLYHDGQEVFTIRPRKNEVDIDRIIRRLDVYHLYFATLTDFACDPNVVVAWIPVKEWNNGDKIWALGTIKSAGEWKSQFINQDEDEKEDV